MGLVKSEIDRFFGFKIKLDCHCFSLFEVCYKIADTKSNELKKKTLLLHQNKPKK